MNGNSTLFAFLGKKKRLGVGNASPLRLYWHKLTASGFPWQLKLLNFYPILPAASVSNILYCTAKSSETQLLKDA